MGQVTIHTGRKEIQFPARINQREELIEYLLVMTGGKTHESLLVTDTPAHEIHIAMLFLGTRGMPEIDPEEWLKNPVITGEPIDIRIRWTEAGKSHEVPAENWITHVATQQPMSPGPWTYNGSWTFQGAFQAEAEKSLFAVFQDRSALVNNPRKDRDDDEMWSVRTQNIPPLNHPVDVILKRRVTSKPKATESQSS